MRLRYDARTASLKALSIIRKSKRENFVQKKKAPIFRLKLLYTERDFFYLTSRKRLGQFMNL